MWVFFCLLVCVPFFADSDRRPSNQTNTTEKAPRNTLNDRAHRENTHINIDTGNLTGRKGLPVVWLEWKSFLPGRPSMFFIMNTAMMLLSTQNITKKREKKSLNWGIDILVSSWEMTKSSVGDYDVVSRRQTSNPIRVKTQIQVTSRSVLRLCGWLLV